MTNKATDRAETWNILKVKSRKQTIFPNLYHDGIRQRLRKRNRSNGGRNCATRRRSWCGSEGVICNGVRVLWDQANDGREWYEGVDRKCTIEDRATRIEMAAETSMKDGSEKVRFGVEQQRWGLSQAGARAKARVLDYSFYF
ncbi:hypothetical protein QYF36_023943 [Acer negundo]|nr:hypothetical protein QYF36_023943 [Acer negundo]